MNRTILCVTWLEDDQTWAVVRGTTIGYRDPSRDRAERFALDHARDVPRAMVRVESQSGTVERTIRF